jgi:hypothetical protein
MAEKRRGFGDTRVCICCGSFDVGLNPLRYDHGSDQRLDGHVSRLGFELQLSVVLVPH